VAATDPPQFYQVSKARDRNLDYAAPNWDRDFRFIARREQDAHGSN